MRVKRNFKKIVLQSKVEIIHSRLRVLNVEDQKLESQARKSGAGQCRHDVSSVYPAHHCGGRVGD